METTDVFRVEHQETGKGPYSVDEVWQRLYDLKDFESSWPSTKDDPKLNAYRPILARKMHKDLDGMHLYFGFPNVRAFNTWFGNPALRAELTRSDFVVRQYRVHKSAARHGKTQSVFVKDAARVVAEYSPLTFGKRSG